MTTKKTTIPDVITGKEAYDMMLLKNENERKVRRFFYYSEIWRAIRDHIESDECCIIIKENPIICHRGTGQAISVSDCYTYGAIYEKEPGTFKTKVVPAPVFNMKVTITYWNEDYDKEYEKEYSIQIPIELLTDFTIDKFNEWVKVQKEKTLKDAHKNAFRNISEILTNLPIKLRKLILKDLQKAQ